MKPILPFLFICASAVPLISTAQTRTMIVTTSSSDVKKFEVSTQTRITFSKDLTEMNVSVADQAQTFNIDDIINITFTIDSTTDLAEQDLNDLKISYSSGIVIISGADNIEYSVWNMSGLKIDSGSGSQIVTVDLSCITAGVYIINANNKTVKFIKH